MPAPNEPQQPRRNPAGAAPTAAPAAMSPQERLGRARPESTVTLMIQSGQAPGGLHPAPTQGAAPMQRPGTLARMWAAIKAWF